MISEARRRCYKARRIIHIKPTHCFIQGALLSAPFSVFDELLAEFLETTQQAGIPKPATACIGVAGPMVVDEQGNTSAKVTNLPWLLDDKNYRFNSNLSSCD